MSVFVSEHTGVANKYRQVVTGNLLTSYFVSSTSAGPLPQAGTQFIRVSADAASFLNLSTTSTGLTLTSTNSFRIPANSAPELFAVSTAFRIQAAST